MQLLVRGHWAPSVRGLILYGPILLTPDLANHANGQVLITPAHPFAVLGALIFTLGTSVFGSGVDSRFGRFWRMGFKSRFKARPGNLINEPSKLNIYVCALRIAG